ncbi:tetratricopeptide repeat [Branchiostoma belcheri]|nr:tetratricopeptide repeat [Branchiostoma belcheri]
MEAQAEGTDGIEGQQPQGGSFEAILEHKSGHFHLPLNILRPSSDQRDIQLKKERLKDQLNNPDEVECTKLALLNLLSMFQYALRQTDEARNTIHDILHTDPHNLNALQNLAHINRELGLESKAQTLEADIARLRGNKDVTSEPDVHVKARVARSMAEQAFALTYDCFSKYEDDEDLKNKLKPCWRGKAQ